MVIYGNAAQAAILVRNENLVKGLFEFISNLENSQLKISQYNG
jgi:hypothetical protein